MIFTDVVEAIKGFSIEEKLQIQLLLQQYLREEGREEIYQNLQSVKQEEENAELTFSENIDELKQKFLSRREFIKLPIEERKKILALQSDLMLEHYQQDKEWQELPIKLIAPITDWKEYYAENIWHVKIEANIKNSLSKDSAVDILQLRGVDVQRLIRKIGECSSEIMEEIAAAIAVVVEYNE